ncbi:MAG: hypothetical protein H6657_00265 [Ardenticatenaceae bacterium]|nr:hypothetical protein [Ardenticatenaceae bacterium]
MKQRKPMNLALAVFLLVAAFVVFWETLLAGPSARTFLAIVMVITSIVLIRRWFVGETT